MQSRTGPVVVLVHGFPGNARDWGPVASLLAGRHDVLVPDLIGFGAERLAPVPETITFAQQARHLEAVVDGLGGRRVVLVGHDVGVPIAALLAASRPENVRGLVLLSGNLVTDPPLAPPMRLVGKPMVGRPMEAAIFSLPALRAMAILGRRSGPRPASNDRAERRAIRAIFAPALHDMAAAFAPVREAVAAVHVPVSLVHGDRDPFVAITEARRFTTLFEDAGLTELQGVGHFPQLERPEAVAGAVDALLVRAEVRASE
jgi:pimeloyl-ACP methyl ester carboxylesterase